MFSRADSVTHVSCLPNPRYSPWRVISVMRTCPCSSPEPPLAPLGKRVPPCPPLARTTKRKWNMSPWYVFSWGCGHGSLPLPHPLGKWTLCPRGHGGRGWGPNRVRGFRSVSTAQHSPKDLVLALGRLEPDCPSDSGSRRTCSSWGKGGAPLPCG